MESCEKIKDDKPNLETLGFGGHLSVADQILF